MNRFTPNASSRPRAFTAALTALGVLAAGTLLASPSVASAHAPSANGLQMNVYYSARDLATEQGTRALYRRIVGAAQEVCPGSDSLYPDVVNRSKECLQTAIARAVGQIGSPQLAAINAQAVARRG
ncbi:MAG: UrcA family protein [Steroidobacteraceae bacterium]